MLMKTGQELEVSFCPHDDDIVRRQTILAEGLLDSRPVGDLSVFVVETEVGRARPFLIDAEGAGMAQEVQRDQVLVADLTAEAQVKHGASRNPWIKGAVELAVETDGVLTMRVAEVEIRGPVVVLDRLEWAQMVGDQSDVAGNLTKLDVPAGVQIQFRAAVLVDLSFKRQRTPDAPVTGFVRPGRTPLADRVRIELGAGIPAVVGTLYLERIARRAGKTDACQQPNQQRCKTESHRYPPYVQAQIY